MRISVNTKFMVMFRFRFHDRAIVRNSPGARNRVRVRVSGKGRTTSRVKTRAMSKSIERVS
jgi:hypothetical protein